MIKFIAVCVAIITAGVFFKVDNIPPLLHWVSGIVTLIGVLIGFGIQACTPKEFEYTDIETESR